MSSHIQQCKFPRRTWCRRLGTVWCCPVCMEMWVLVEYVGTKYWAALKWREGIKHGEG